jgi:hypothetical protein
MSPSYKIIQLSAFHFDIISPYEGFGDSRGGWESMLPKGMWMTSIEAAEDFLMERLRPSTEKYPRVVSMYNAFGEKIHDGENYIDNPHLFREYGSGSLNDEEGSE